MIVALNFKNNGKKSKIQSFGKIMYIKKESPSVETERPLTIACHMKKS
jgi:hypothetical protein